MSRVWSLFRDGSTCALVCRRCVRPLVLVLDRDPYWRCVACSEHKDA